MRESNLSHHCLVVDEAGGEHNVVGVGAGVGDVQDDVVVHVHSLRLPLGLVVQRHGLDRSGHHSDVNSGRCAANVLGKDHLEGVVARYEGVGGNQRVVAHPEAQQRAVGEGAGRVVRGLLAAPDDV